MKNRIRHMIDFVRQLFASKHNLEAVFTPSTSAFLTFVERPDLDKQINKALLLPGTQLIMYGHSGSGKSTIIQNTLKDKGIKCITTNCILDTTVNNIILDAFDKLNPFYTSETGSKTGAKIAPELKGTYLSIDATIKSELSVENNSKQMRALPTQLTAQRLAEFLGAANVLWVIEDFHKVAAEERQKLSQIFKIFVDASNKYKNMKIIAIGAVGTAREVVNYDPELNNRVAEIQVPLMTVAELEGIIKKGERLLNIDFDEKVHSEIIRFSNSLAAICHHLCFSICFNNEVRKTTKFRKEFNTDSLETAVIDYLKQNSDSFKETIDRALKPREHSKCENLKPLLITFCQSNKDELTKKEVHNFRDNKRKFPSNISECLKLLTTADYGEILRFDENSGRYSFSNPFFKAYTIMQFTTEDKEDFQDRRKLDIDLIMEILAKTSKNFQFEIKSE